MKIYVLVLLATAGFFGTLLPSQDYQILLFNNNEQFDPKQEIIPTQPITDQNGLVCANKVGEIISLSKRYQPTETVVVDFVNKQAQVLDKKNIYIFNHKNKAWEITTQKVINQDNWVQSSSKIISKFANNNQVLQTLSFIGCARSMGCLVWALGTPALTAKYLCWHLFLGVTSSALGYVSCNDTQRDLFIASACGLGLFIGLSSR